MKGSLMRGYQSLGDKACVEQQTTRQKGVNVVLMWQAGYMSGNYFHLAYTQHLWIPYYLSPLKYVSLF